MVKRDCLACKGTGAVPTGHFIIEPLPDPRPLVEQIEFYWGEDILETCLSKALKN